MGCRDIRETISACVDGEASPEAAALVREHLASCERCRVLERQMRAVGAGSGRSGERCRTGSARTSLPVSNPKGRSLRERRSFPRHGVGRRSAGRGGGRWGSSSSPRGMRYGILILRVPPRPGSRHPPFRPVPSRECGSTLHRGSGDDRPARPSPKTRALSTRTATRRGWNCSPRETPRIRRTLPGAEGAAHDPASLPFRENDRTCGFPPLVRDPSLVVRDREAYFLARAAGEVAAESIAPDPPRVDNVPRERLERWRAMPPRSASGSGSGTVGGRSCAPEKAGADHGAEPSMAGPRGAAALPEGSPGYR